ncbi:MAG: hypothetical protein Q4B01_07645 [Eubacteriales bacterium]|nr:hypothetical protein [Eubacteriales bacterium]
MEKDYTTVRRILAVVALGQMVAALGLMAYGLTKLGLNTTQSSIIMACSLTLYWVLMDILEPRITHRFDGIVPEQKTAYYKFIGLDLIGYIGILVFLFSMGGNQSTGLIGAVVFAVVMKPKRTNQNIFYGIEPIPGTEEEEEPEETEEAEEPAEIEEDK